MDDRSFPTTIKRFWQVGSTVGGLAARVAGQQYLGRDIDDVAYARELKAKLGTIKGPMMKVAQFLATIPDAIPPEYAAELLGLQSQAPAMGIPFVRRRMAAELGADWQTHFREFDLVARAAASLGQVHYAVDLAGQPVACKLQYPQMQSMVEADLSNLKLALGLYHVTNKALDTSDVQDEIKNRLLEELDYHHEAEQMAIYRSIFQDDPYIGVPQQYPALSTGRLLTMEWMAGDPLLTYLNHDENFRNHIADQLFKAWYKPFYHHGVIHGDPHPGNYLVTQDGKINLLDFGCVRHFPPEFVQGVIDLYQSFLHNQPDKAVQAYEAWGFKNLSKEMIDVMNQWARVLYDPLLDNRVRPIQNNFSASAGWEAATKIHSELHRLGGIRPPKEFVFMDRASVGLGGVFMRLRVERNWHRLFEELIEGYPGNF